MSIAARLLLAVLVFIPGTFAPGGPLAGQLADRVDGTAASGDADRVESLVRARLEEDLALLRRFRPGYAFWEHVFRVPDGSVVFGSAGDGHLLVTFPVGDDWNLNGDWAEPGLARALAGHPLPSRLGDRRDRVAELLEPVVGEVVHNPTRGDFLLPNIERYGGFLEEWGRIYERFGVPAEIGLAQAVVESGLSGDIKSEARAIGLCQWLPRNWSRLEGLMPYPIEVENQTTQAAFCAAHLAILATMYGSFLPALSHHHAGGANVGRTIINGGRLGAGSVAERYLVGADLARDLRALSPRTFRPVVGTYGPRSYHYTEMVFGNTATVARILESTEQETIHAMRVPRNTSFDEVIRASGLTKSVVSRFNPALVRRVPRGAAVYLPEPVESLGEDVSFWHRPPSPSFQAVLADFLELDATLDEWEQPDFEDVLQAFRDRFRETDTEEGRVMAALLGYTIQELPLGRRVLAEFRESSRVDELFRRGVRLRDDGHGR
ncbi:MAG: transglycosylase SLT domain-containing protein [Gemmatimonadota bacterium]|jgi:hypothetical protein